MEVKILNYAKKEAMKLGAFAAQIFWQSIDTIKEKGWEKIVPGGDIRDFKGKQKGAYEIRLSGYRTIFTKPKHALVIVIAFFKKEDHRLKDGELDTIKKRMNDIVKIYDEK